MYVSLCLSVYDYLFIYICVRVCLRTYICIYTMILNIKSTNCLEPDCHSITINWYTSIKLPLTHIIVTIPLKRVSSYQSPQERNGRAGMSDYLRPSSTVCSPCALSYDYIIRTETFSEDLACIANKLQLEGIDPALRVNNKLGGSRSTTYREYYKGIPYEVLRGIFFVYEEDFFLFGFDLPPFLLEALREWWNCDRLKPCSMSAYVIKTTGLIIFVLLWNILRVATGIII